MLSISKCFCLLWLTTTLSNRKCVVPENIHTPPPPPTTEGLFREERAGERFFSGALSKIGELLIQKKAASLLSMLSFILY